ncbi:hypothetical protein F5051DRAFT_427068 [Lentinula edodes]|nr:hypothetical protein F5051DRAFT_427068 [Lentinula edodes]
MYINHKHGIRRSSFFAKYVGISSPRWFGIHEKPVSWYQQQKYKVQFFRIYSSSFNQNTLGSISHYRRVLYIDDALKEILAYIGLHLKRRGPLFKWFIATKSGKNLLYLQTDTIDTRNAISCHPVAINHRHPRILADFGIGNLTLPSGVELNRGHASRYFGSLELSLGWIIKRRQNVKAGDERGASGRCPMTAGQDITMPKDKSLPQLTDSGVQPFSQWGSNHPRNLCKSCQKEVGRRSVMTSQRKNTSFERKKNELIDGQRRPIEYGHGYG